jgi:thiol-disulfide isomerase/thioredoxin
MISLFISSLGLAQAGYEITKDPATNEKMLVGSIQKENLSADPAFNAWYGESQRIYPTPNAGLVKALKENAHKIYLVIFGATWCEDSHFILPKLFKIQEAAGFPENRIVLYALDHNKKMTSPITEAFGVDHTPTVIVMRDGKELGRLIEYGKTGQWEEELTAIINTK